MSFSFTHRRTPWGKPLNKGAVHPTAGVEGFREETICCSRRRGRWEEYHKSLALQPTEYSLHTLSYPGSKFKSNKAFKVARHYKFVDFQYQFKLILEINKLLMLHIVGLL
jgi:hypothetical protein